MGERHADSDSVCGCGWLALSSVWPQLANWAGASRAAFPGEDCETTRPLNKPPSEMEREEYRLYLWPSFQILTLAGSVIQRL